MAGMPPPGPSIRLCRPRVDGRWSDFWKVGQYGWTIATPISTLVESLKPVERVGSQLLYYVPPGTLRAP